jgi:hypothetical protein
MADPAALRQALTAFLGAERFRKLIKQFHSAGRLRFWQEQAWSGFVTAHPEFAVTLDELTGVLRICWVHGAELQNDTIQIIDGNVDFADWYVRVKAVEFPCSASSVWSEGYPLPARSIGVWFCPECRAAETVWQQRQATPP